MAKSFFSFGSTSRRGNTLFSPIMIGGKKSTYSLFKESDGLYGISNSKTGIFKTFGTKKQVTSHLKQNSKWYKRRDMFM